jgi:general secretion pathway protein C
MKRKILVTVILLAIVILYLGVRSLDRAEEQIPPDNMIKKIPASKLLSSSVSSDPETMPPASVDTQFHERALPQAEKLSEDKDVLKQAGLSLKLRGILSPGNQDPDSIRAVIEKITTREQNLYKVGDSIGNAVIAEIHKDRVELDVNGRRISLRIEGSTAQKSRAVPDLKTPSFQSDSAGGSGVDEAMNNINDQTGGIASQEDRADSSESSYAGAAPEKHHGPIKSKPGEPIPVKLSEINDAFNNVEDLVTQVRVKPVFKNEQPEGILLSNIEPESVLKQIGLRIGDIITGINGQKISTVDEALTFHETLSPGDKVTVQLKRRGRDTAIEYIIE